MNYVQYLFNIEFVKNGLTHTGSQNRWQKDKAVKINAMSSLFLMPHHWLISSQTQKESHIKQVVEIQPFSTKFRSLLLGFGQVFGSQITSESHLAKKW